MVKHGVLIVLFLMGAFEAAASARRRVLVECRVTEIVNGGVFEEGLSVDEYPIVRVVRNASGVAIKMGTTTYSQVFGDQVLARAAVGFNKSYIIFPADGGDALTLTVKGRQRLGEIRIADDDTSSFVLVAKLNCR